MIDINDFNESYAKKKVVIFDEADALMDGTSVIFTKKLKKWSISGMICAYCAKKVIILSAFISQFHDNYANLLL